jgi:hypothetical protein
MRALVVLVALLSTTAASAQVYVHGYTTKNGTYVAPHYRSTPDGNPYNNWSTVGNVNPYTGQAGTKNPYGYGSTYNPYSYAAPSYTPPSYSCLYCSSNQTTQSSSEDGSDPQ